MIRLEIQYDINRERAKISALSSGEIHKYENLTGEDILPSNQQQIIEQDLKPKEKTKAIADKSDDKLSTQKETYNELLNERLGEIQDISKKIDYNNLSYHFKDLLSPLINFIKLKGPFGFF